MNTIVIIKLPHAQTERRFNDKTEAKAFMVQARTTYGPTADIFMAEREPPQKKNRQTKNTIEE